jgi:hypothetical protein
MTEKDRIIEAILEIELRMFLTVNPMQTSGCLEHPESFKLHRDLLAMQAGGESLSEKVYDYLVRASGYASLEEAEKKLNVRVRRVEND